jgi:membrane protein required for colicin V production
VFGVARGFLLAVVAFAIFNWLVSEKQQPEWVKNARTRPLLTETASRLVAILPADAAETINGWIQSRANAATNSLSPADSAAASRPKTEDDQSIAIPSQPQKKPDSTAGSSGSAMDKQKLDALINKNAPFAPAPKQ